MRLHEVVELLHIDRKPWQQSIINKMLYSNCSSRIACGVGIFLGITVEVKTEHDTDDSGQYE